MVWKATLVLVMFKQIRVNVGKLLEGIDRYNAENLTTIQHYRELIMTSTYELEHNSTRSKYTQ
uniref:Uncharacterized protein n=1 Tax=Marmota marmota marmota TaxID=9994 RepID=A0A8C6EW06_MARMA